MQSSATTTVHIVGAGGQLGGALQARAAAHPTMRVHPLTSSDLDITQDASVHAALADIGAGDVVINCAAYTDVDGAQSDPAGAHRINADGPANLAKLTAASGAWLIHISTDYVFSGDADRIGGYEPCDSGAVSPATVYGASKLAGERAALAADPRSTIVRTAWVYTGGPDSRDFVGTMRRLEQSRDTVSVVNDQVGSPTYALDLADGLWDLVAAGPTDATAGAVLHATNAGQASWFDVARAVFTAVGASADRVMPCTTAEFPRPAPRPAFSVLSGASWAAAGLDPLRDWRTALSAAIAAPNPPH